MAGPGKCSFYVWFLGAKESKGLRGEEFITPVVKYLCQKEYEAEPGKVTLQVSEKGLKVIQNVAVTRNPSGISTGISEVVKHFIPHHAITYVIQQEDIIACIVLMYNPLTKCPLHAHVYRCDSEETADFLRNQLEALVSLPENQRKVTELEDRLKSQGLIPTGNAKLLKSSDTGFGGSMDFDNQSEDMELERIKDTHQETDKSRKSVRSAGQSPDQERIATLYDSLAAELRSKLKVKTATSILLPPKDYETETTTRFANNNKQNSQRHFVANSRSANEPEMDSRRSTLNSNAELTRPVYHAKTPVMESREKTTRLRETVVVKGDRSSDRNAQLSRSSSHPQTRINRENYNRSHSREDLEDSSEPSSGIGSDHPPSPLFERSVLPAALPEERPFTREDKNAARERFQGARAVFRSLEKGVQGQSTNNRLTTKSSARYPEEKQHRKVLTEDRCFGRTASSRNHLYEDQPRQSHSLSHAKNLRRSGSKPNLYKGYDYDDEENDRNYDVSRERERDRDRHVNGSRKDVGGGMHRVSSKTHVYEDDRSKPFRSMSYQEPRVNDHRSDRKRFSYHEPDNHGSGREERERTSRRDATNMEAWSTQRAEVYLRDPVVAHIPLVSNKDRYMGRSMMDLRSGSDEYNLMRKLDRHASQEGFLDRDYGPTPARNDRVQKAQYVDHGHSKKEHFDRDRYHDERTAKYNQTSLETPTKRKPENRQVKHPEYTPESRSRIPGLDRESARLDHHLLKSSSTKLNSYARSPEERDKRHYYGNSDPQR